VEGLGDLKISTIAKLIDKNWISISINPNIKDQFNEYDEINIEDNDNVILVKGIKKLVELDV
jgi:hypothetical protein